VIENQKEIENMEITDILHKSTSKILFRNGIYSLLRRCDASGSIAVIYRVWRISLLCGSGIL